MLLYNYTVLGNFQVSICCSKLVSDDSCCYPHFYRGEMGICNEILPDLTSMESVELLSDIKQV